MDLQQIGDTNAAYLFVSVLSVTTATFLPGVVPQNAASIIHRLDGGGSSSLDGIGDTDRTMSDNDNYFIAIVPTGFGRSGGGSDDDADAVQDGSVG